MNKKRLGLIGFHDGSVGQILSYVKNFNEFEVKCICAGEVDFEYINIQEEKKQRDNKQIEFPIKDKFYDIDFYPGRDWIDYLIKNKINNAFCLNPSNILRAKEIEICKSKSINLINIIHPSTLVMKNVKFGKNIWINANVFIGFKSELNDGVIVNSSCSIDHHNVIGYSSQLDPRVTTAGFVSIGNFCHVHMGVNIGPKVKLGPNSEIGASSLVLKDTEEGYLYYGTPIKKIKKTNDSKK